MNLAARYPESGAWSCRPERDIDSAICIEQGPIDPQFTRATKPKGVWANSPISGHHGTSTVETPAGKADELKIRSRAPNVTASTRPYERAPSRGRTPRLKPVQIGLQSTNVQATELRSPSGNTATALTKSRKRP